MTIKTMTMPQLGESVTEGTISQWLIQAGDTIEQYQPVLEVMTDKVNAEVPALYSGKIVRLLANENETVDVGTPICEILIESNQDEVTVENTNSSGTLQTDKSEAETKQEIMKNRYSPAVLTLAQEHQINLSELTGTGLSGRIT